MFNSITIIGPGLIGASIAMSSHKCMLSKKIKIWARNENKRNLCLKQPWCHHAYDSLEDSVNDSDFIIIATPVDKITEFLGRITPYIKKDAIITDVGSIKSKICFEAENLFEQKKHAFVGSHPMAGSEKGGMEFATETLLKNAPCILTPMKNSIPRAIEKIEIFWRKLGMKTFQMDPNAHDSLVAHISHLPHVIASALCASLSNLSKESFKYSAGGLRDTTRIAAGNPDLWMNIIKYNSNEILKALESFEKEIHQLKKDLIAKDFNAIFETLSKGQNIRKKIENSIP